MQAVIMAGGKGTRLSSITNDEIPKPMVRLNDKPILEYQVECLKRCGITEYYFIVGHLGDRIKEYFADGSRFGVHISYYEEAAPLGSAGALYYLKDVLKEDFLVVFGDIIFDIDVQKLTDFHKQKNALVTLLVHPNSHPFDSDLVVLDEECRVINFDSKNNVRDYDYRNIVNAGIYMLNEAIFDCYTEPKKMDMEKDVIFPVIQKQGNVYGYISSEYVKDVGTPERLLATEKDLVKGYVAKKNLNEPQSVIYLTMSAAQSMGLETLVSLLKEGNRSVYLMKLLDDGVQADRHLETELGNQGVYLDGYVAIETFAEEKSDASSSWILYVNGADLKELSHDAYHLFCVETESVSEFISRYLAE